MKWSINRRRRKRESRQAIQEAVDLKDRNHTSLVQAQRKLATEQTTVVQPLRRTRDRLKDENHIADMIAQSLQRGRGA